MSIPNSQSWPPRNEDELAQAAANGTLEETHYLDLKRELPTGTSANKEIAKDIAAFSEDGGVIIIGVNEDTTPPSLTPVPLANLAERIEQVGLTRVDEAVTVKTTKIPSKANPNEGYLLVEVPVSPRPPHMVDNKYYARGDKTNIPLSHPAVLRRHERLLAQNTDIAAEAIGLVEEIRRRIGDVAVMSMLAKPLGARDDLLAQLAVPDSTRSDVATLLRAAGTHQTAAPSLRQPMAVLPRLGGVAATSWSGTEPFENHVDQAEVTLHDSGAIKLLSGGVIGMSGGAWRQESTPRVMESVVVGHVDLVVRLAGHVAEYGFNGSWRFGLAVAGIYGATSFVLSSQGGYDGQMPVCTESVYSRAVTASLTEIQQSPEAISLNLVGPLLRGLSSTKQFPWLFGG